MGLKSSAGPFVLRMRNWPRFITAPLEAFKERQRHRQQQGECPTDNPLQSMTERVHQLEMLRLNLATIRLAKMGGWEYDFARHTCCYTPECSQLLDLTEENENSLQALLHSFTPEAQPLLSNQLQTAMKQGKAFEAIYKRLNRHGKERWIKLVCVTEKRDGSVIKLRGWMQDVTAPYNREHFKRQQEWQEQQQSVQRTLWEHENELGRIAFELHENIAQILVVSRNYIQVTQQEPETDIRKLDEGIKILERAIFQVRDLYEKIEVPSLDLLGLEGIMDVLVQKENQLGSAQLTLTEFNETLEEIDNIIKLAIYRIAKEALHNIRKHAQATESWIALCKVEDQVLLTIKDDGIGFYPSSLQWRQGLQKIHAMTHALGGRFNLESSPGRGCEVQVCIPMLQKKRLMNENYLL